MTKETPDYRRWTIEKRGSYFYIVHELRKHKIVAIAFTTHYEAEDYAKKNIEPHTN